MKIGWLQDKSDYIGGAELTAKAFREAAPPDATIIDCPPGQIETADAYIVHNCTQYGPETIEAIEGKPVVKYVHDMWPHGSHELREWLCMNAHPIFCSPLHFDKFPYETQPVVGTIPPPCRLDRVEGERTKEAVWLGHGMNPGKGIGQAISWAHETGTQLDFIGEGPYLPADDGVVRTLPPVPYEEVPALLATYKRFVFLPTKIEPFGRSVAEAWAAGCELVTNRMIGANYWITEAPDRLHTATTDFWNAVEWKCS